MAHKASTPDPEALRAALVRCMLKARRDALLDAPAVVDSPGDDAQVANQHLSTLSATSGSSNGRAIRTVVGVTGADD